MSRLPVVIQAGSFVLTFMAAQRPHKAREIRGMYRMKPAHQCSVATRTSSILTGNVSGIASPAKAITIELTTLVRIIREDPSSLRHSVWIDGDTEEPQVPGQARPQQPQPSE